MKACIVILTETHYNSIPCTCLQSALPLLCSAWAMWAGKQQWFCKYCKRRTTGILDRMSVRYNKIEEVLTLRWIPFFVTPDTLLIFTKELVHWNKKKNDLTHLVGAVNKLVLPLYRFGYITLTVCSVKSIKHVVLTLQPVVRIGAILCQYHCM